MACVRSLAILGTLAALLAPVAPAHAGGDPEFGSQWGLTQVRAPEAWAATTGEGIRIGIVDTGVDIGHEDLAGKVVAHTACVGSAGDPGACGGSGQDDHGHGTHVAGVAAALRGNGKGIAGVAPSAHLVVVKVVTAQGVVWEADVVAGIKWVVDHGARVVNLSLSDPEFTVVESVSERLEDALDYATARGVVTVLASGTPEQFGLSGAAVHDLDSLVVASTDRHRQVPGGSASTGQALLALLAPGGTSGIQRDAGVLSTFWSRTGDDAYVARAGTSVAAAFVSGGVALLMAQGYDRWGSIDRVLRTADGRVPCDMGSPSCYGLMDLAAATAP